MKHNTFTAIFLLIFTAVLFSGCTGESSKPQAVIIDTHVISEATGINERIEKRIETVKQQISEDMDVLSTRLSKELDDEKARYGDNPSAEDKKKIQTLRIQLRKEIMQARHEASTKLAKEKSDIRDAFFDSTKLVAQEVALEQGASIIIRAHAGILWFDDTLDITNEVIRRIAPVEEDELSEDELSTDDEQN